jgi:hypothetical protein
MHLYRIKAYTHSGQCRVCYLKFNTDWDAISSGMAEDVKTVAVRRVQHG